MERNPPDSLFFFGEQRVHAQWVLSTMQCQFGPAPACMRITYLPVVFGELYCAVSAFLRVERFRFDVLVDEAILR
jgi:hypothetical protein